ncbi:aminotransferase class I/II-fold pyridoxal phosphate-dependent enzyme [uncultured Muriicola sp.]|uniref:aminotransferase class I/II-fold pyridoxal phosphate-dependent enzyme n=1 Tax=uncultured Muriicola sp. TaxID=1583102 RepID=UPI002604EE2A|nr:aminotransferase class I/II-fold pyridoxal phosphate-dependent enzyme [uncultured Muriicola sp.]
MTGLPKKLNQKLQERSTRNALRELQAVSRKIDFVSNDYLGMARDEVVFHGAHKLLIDRGIIQNGSTGSRLLSGNSVLYEETEQYLAEYYKADAALIFNSGYDANLGLFSSVPQRTDVVVFDEYIHASMRDGIRMGTAKSLKFKHNDLDDLTSILQRVRKDSDKGTECYVVTEAVFSMDGDSPDLERLTALCKEYQCKLILDEAHSIQGVDDTVEDHSKKELRDKVLFARIVTFGKAMGVQGSAILGSNDLKSYLLNFARSFIYTTALPPIIVASILTAFRTIETAKIKERKKGLKENIGIFNKEIYNLKLGNSFIPSTSAIHSCIVPGNSEVKKIAAVIQEKGYDIRPILSPTVPEGQERLRFCLHSYNTEKEIKEVLSILASSINAEFYV